MAGRPSKEQWRTRVEHFLESDMSVYEWCAVNRISSSAMFRRLNAFAEEEPELFGGAQNIVDRSHSGWIGKTRENMRAANALSVPSRPCEPSGFARIEEVATIPAVPEQPCAPGALATAPTITVTINGAVVGIPSGCAQADMRAVLEVVASL